MVEPSGAPGGGDSTALLTVTDLGRSVFSSPRAPSTRTNSGSGTAFARIQPYVLSGSGNRLDCRSLGLSSVLRILPEEPLNPVFGGHCNLGE
jgi:hypothetical protein